MAPFRHSKKYAFYWRMKREIEAQRRSYRGGVNSAVKIDFDAAMKLDTVLENAAYQEASSFM